MHCSVWCWVCGQIMVEQRIWVSWMDDWSMNWTCIFFDPVAAPKFARWTAPGEQLQVTNFCWLHSRQAGSLFGLYIYMAAPSLLLSISYCLVASISCVTVYMFLVPIMVVKVSFFSPWNSTCILQLSSFLRHPDSAPLSPLRITQGIQIPLMHIYDIVSKISPKRKRGNMHHACDHANTWYRSHWSMLRWTPVNVWR